MTPRRVLLLHSSAGGYGADRQLELIAAGLDRDRYVPDVVLAQDGPLAGRLRGAGVEVHVEPLAVLRRADLTPRGLARLGRGFRLATAAVADLIRSRRVELVHSNTSVTLSGAAGARRTGVPHVWHVREIYAGFGLLWPPYRRILTSAAALPCVSEAVRDQFSTTSPALVLHDGIAIPTAIRPTATGPLRCAILGRISAWKGQEIALRALAAVPQATLTVAGDAWPGQESRAQDLRALATELGVAERVQFAGFVADPAAIYAEADVVIVASTRPDPLPNAALEGAAAGCCVVASNHGGLPEIVRDGATGLLVPPGDVTALADALSRLARDRDLAGRLGAAAREDVARRFGILQLLGGLQELYDEVLDRRALRNRD